MREELAAVKARLLRLERRFDAAGLDTLPGGHAPGSAGDSPVSLLDAIGEGLEAIGALKP